MMRLMISYFSKMMHQKRSYQKLRNYNV